MSIAALFIITKTWSNGGTNKEDVVDIYSEILLNNNKNEIMPSEATWMALDKPEKDKYHMISTISGFKKKVANELNYKTEIDPQK